MPGWSPAHSTRCSPSSPTPRWRSSVPNSSTPTAACRSRAGRTRRPASCGPRHSGCTAAGVRPREFVVGACFLVRRAAPSRCSVGSTSGTGSTAKRPTSATGPSRPAGRWCFAEAARCGHEGGASGRESSELVAEHFARGSDRFVFIHHGPAALVSYRLGDARRGARSAGRPPASADPADPRLQGSWRQHPPQPADAGPASVLGAARRADSASRRPGRRALARGVGRGVAAQPVLRARAAAAAAVASGSSGSSRRRTCSMS